MSRISEKVAYLDGLMEGLNLHEDKYAKVFTAIVDTLDLIAEEMADHEDTLADLDESIDEIFENLDEYDDFLYGDEDEDDEDEFDDDDFFEIVCPNCGDTIYFDQDMLDKPDGLICPHCNEPIELNIPDKDEE